MVNRMHCIHMSYAEILFIIWSLIQTSFLVMWLLPESRTLDSPDCWRMPHSYNTGSIHLWISSKRAGRQVYGKPYCVIFNLSILCICVKMLWFKFLYVFNLPYSSIYKMKSKAIYIQYRTRSCISFWKQVSWWSLYFSKCCQVDWQILPIKYLKWLFAWNSEIKLCS